MKVAVLGAGIVGLSAAWHLARRGHSVSVYEQFAPGHRRGSSHGRSRIVRRAYPDPAYTAAMAEAYPLWAELERTSGKALLHEVGLVYFGRADAPDIVSVARGLQDLAVPHEVHDPSAVRRVFPALRLAPGEAGVWTPQAGWVSADETLAALREVCEGLGVVFRWEERADPDAVEGDSVIEACGAWTRLGGTVTQQTVAYVDAPLEGPVWIQDSPLLEYGFPSEPGSAAFKVGIHAHGPVQDPDGERPGPSLAALEAIEAVAALRFGIERPQIMHAETCLYTNRPDDHFAFGPTQRGWSASACSGHGFKFGLWSGKVLAEAVESGTLRVPEVMRVP